MKKAFLSLIVIIITTFLLLTMTSCGSEYKNIEYIDYFLTAPTIDSLNDKLGDYSSYDYKNLGKYNYSSFDITWYTHTFTYNDVSLGEYEGSVDATHTYGSSVMPDTSKAKANIINWSIKPEKDKTEELFNGLAEYLDKKYNTHKDTTSTSVIKATKEYTYEIEKDKKTVSLMIIDNSEIFIVVDVE